MKKCYLLFAAMLTIGAYSTQAQTITTIAGIATAGYTGDGGPATAASFKNPIGGIARDAAGNLYVCDGQNYCVRKITPAGIISTFAGDYMASALGDGGPATAAHIVIPQAVAVDPSGNVFITDLDNRVRRVDATTGIITTYAGMGSVSGSGPDNVQATASKLDQPQALACDAAGNLYISEYGAAKVRVVAPSGIITTFAGTGVSGFSGDGGPATAAKVKAVGGIAVDKSGNVYLADGANSNIREIVKATGNIVTYAGAGPGSAGDGGPATAALFSLPTGIAFDTAGNLLIADMANHKIRKITTSSMLVSTVAGDGTNAFMGDGGPATAAQMSQPTGVVFDATNNMYITDGNNHRVRKVTPAATIAVLGASTPLCTSKTATLSTATTGGTWSSSNTAIAKVGSSTGVVTGVAAGTATITYKTATAEGTKLMAVIFCGVSVKNVVGEDEGLKVYPNPTYSTVNILLSSPVDEEATVTITNMIGEKVKELKMKTNKPLDIQLNSPAGIYFLNVVTPHGRWSEKITQLN